MQPWLLRSAQVTAAVVAGLTVAVLAGCAAAPRPDLQRGARVDTGPDSLEAVRRQLSGTWELVSFEAFTVPGEATQVRASGRLTYDEFGNLTVTGQVDEIDRERDRATLFYMSGRLAFDLARRRFLILDAVTNLPFEEADFATASLDRFRHYEFVDDLLRLTVRDERGEATALLTWRRIE